MMITSDTGNGRKLTLRTVFGLMLAVLLLLLAGTAAADEYVRVRDLTYNGQNQVCFDVLTQNPGNYFAKVQINGKWTEYNDLSKVILCEPGDYPFEIKLSTVPYPVMQTGTIRIKKVPVTVSWANGLREYTYNGTVRKPYPQVFGIIGNQITWTETVTDSAGETVLNPIDAGSYRVTVTLEVNPAYRAYYALPDEDNLNYSYSILPAGLNVTWPARTKDYDGAEWNPVPLSVTDDYGNNYTNGLGTLFSVSYDRDRKNVTDNGFTATVNMINTNFTVKQGLRTTFMRTPKAVTVSLPSDKKTFTYNGKQQMPAVKDVVLGGVVSGDSVAVTSMTPSGAATAAGTCSIVAVTLNNSNYKAPADLSGLNYTIQPRTLSNAVITLSDTQLTFTGSTREVWVTGVTLDGMALTTNDYTVSGYRKGTAVSTYTVTVTGTGNYTGTASTAWSIMQYAMTVNSESIIVPYDANAHGIQVSVKYPSYGAVIKYGREAGTYNLNTSPTITSPGVLTVYYRVTDSNGYYEPYTGVETVTIQPINVNNPVITLSTNTYTYDGKEKKPSVTVYYGDAMVSADEYTTEYTNNTNAGNATVTVRAKSGGHYSFTGTATFTILPKAVTNPTITLSDEVFTYDGKEHKPDVTVMDGETVIDPSEYNVLYSANITAGNLAMVTLMDLDGGNYTVSGKKTFVINPKTVTVTGVTAADKMYDRTTTATITGKAVVEGKVEGDDVDVALGTAAFTNPNVGTGKTVKFADCLLFGAASGNYVLAAQPEGTASITQKPVTVTGMTAASRDYDPDNLQVTLSGGTLSGVLAGDTVGIDISGASGLIDDPDAGEHKPVSVAGVRLTGEKAGNYMLSGQPADVTVTINRIANPATVRSTSWVKKGGNTTDLSGNISMAAGSISYAITGALEGCSVNAETGVFTSGTGSGTCVVTVTIAGDTNHLGTTAEIAVTVTDKNIQELAFEKKELTKAYGDKAFTNPLTGAQTAVSYTVTEGKDVCSVGNDGTVTIKGIGTAVITATAAETEQYAPAAASYTLTVEKAAATVTAPTAKDGLVYNGSEQELIKAGKAEGGTMMYALSTDGEKAPESGWSAGIPKTAEAGTRYVWYKAAGDKNHSDSAAAAVKTVIAPKSIAGATVTLDVTQVQADGSEQWVLVTGVCLDGKTLNEDDYEIKGNNGTQIGKYTVTVTGRGNYTDSATAKWEIVEKAMMVTAQNVTAIYDGKDHHITVNVFVPGTGATVRYGVKEGEYNLSEPPVLENPGTITTYYRVTASGYDDYEGLATVTVTQTYPLVTAPTAKTGLIYSGKAQVLAEAGSVSGGTMQYALGLNDSTAPASGWTAAVPQATDAGTWYVWYKAIGDKTHGDTTPEAIPVSIGQKSIEKASVTLDSTQVQYDGTEKKVTVTGVTVDGLTLGADEYDVYGNAGAAIGKYTVTVTGKGNYTGTSRAKWKIVSNAMTVEHDNVTAPYDGAAHSISVKVTVPESGASIRYGLEEDSCTLETPPSIIDAGVLAIYFQITAPGYDDYDGVATITVTKADPTIKTLPAARSGLTENGEKQALITAGDVSGGTMVYAPGEDDVTVPSTAAFTTDIPTGIAAGTYTVWYMVTGDGNHLDTAPMPITATIGKKVIPDGLYQDPELGWVLIRDGEVDTGYTGLYNDATYGTWLVVKGKIDFSYTGLFNDGKLGWQLVGSGALCTWYNGLWGDPTYGWWLIKGGAVDFGFTGLYYDEHCGWWLISGGSVAFDYSGLWGDPTYGWWLIKGGTVDFGFTGLYNDEHCGWWLIGSGRVCFEYYGLWNDPTYGWWLISGGAVDFGYNGLCYDVNCGWWLIRGGSIAWNYYGLYYDDAYGWWLINSGAVDWGFTGLYYDASYGWWLIDHAGVAFSYNGLWNDPTYGCWLVQGGCINFGYTGYYDDPVYGRQYVENGKMIDFKNV